MSRALGVVTLICVLAAQGCTIVNDPAAEAEASAAAAAAAAPRECPEGFARALKPKRPWALLTSTRSSSKEVPPESLPLPKVLTSKIVCALRQKDVRQTGDYVQVIAIMRADLSYEDVRHELWNADFDSEGRDTVYVRSRSVPLGGIEAALTAAFGSSPAFAPVEDLFPPATQVAFFSIKSKPRKSKPQPSVPSLGNLEPGTVDSWSCGWSPTINNDWHDDVLCTNGTRQERPYLLPNDPFVTRDEIMRAASEYERHLNRE